MLGNAGSPAYVVLRRLGLKSSGLSQEELLA